jgi:hypothetical protein
MPERNSTGVCKSPEVLVLCRTCLVLDRILTFQCMSCTEMSDKGKEGGERQTT